MELALMHMKSASGTPALSNLLELFTDWTASRISQGQKFAFVLQIKFCNSYMDERVYIQIDVTKSMLSWQETKLSFLIELPIWLHGTYLTITGRWWQLTLPLNTLTSPTVCSKFKTMTSFIFYILQSMFKASRIPCYGVQNFESWTRYL